MKFLMAIVLAFVTGAQTKPAGSTKVAAALDFTMNTINGNPVNLSKYQGKVVLMVNVASQCGFTPQYAGLEDLHRKYASKGLSILGFPPMISEHRSPERTPTLHSSAGRTTVLSSTCSRRLW